MSQEIFDATPTATDQVQPGRIAGIPQTKPQYTSTALTATTPASLLEMAVQSGANMETMERLLAMQERWEANEARKAFHAAMAAFKAEPMTIFKDKRVRFTTQKGTTEYDHATLGNVVSIVAPLLAKHQLGHAWVTEHQAGKVQVTCRVTHAMGHSESVSLSAPPDDSGGKNSIQALGSVITYLQRYTLLAITGMATDDMGDDDGRSAGAADTDPGNDDVLSGFQDAAMLGEAALREHYEKNTPSDEFWKRHNRDLKAAAKAADKMMGANQ